MSEESISFPETAVSMFAEYICQFDREVFAAIFCDSANRPLCCSILSVGIVNQAYASPRELLKMAFLANASGVLIMHNHPSGKCRPSDNDMMTTIRMKKACEILDFKFLDHIIVGNEMSETFYSITAGEEKHMPYNKIRYDPDMIKLYRDEDLDKVAEDLSIYEDKHR